MQTVSAQWSDLSSLQSLKSQLPQTYRSLLVQVFWGKEKTEEIPILQQQLKQVFPDAQVMGTLSAGEILHGKVLEQQVIIVVSAFTQTEVKTLLLERADQTTGCSSLIEHQLMPIIKNCASPKLLLCFLDGACDGDAFVHAVGHFHPDLPIAGGLGRGPITAVFDDERMVPYGAAIAILNSEVLQVHQQFNFNWKPIGPKFRVTKAEKNIIYEIEGQKALDFYAKYLGRELVEQFMPLIAMEFPLVFEKGGVLVARACLQVLDDGALLYAGDFESGQVVQFGMGAGEQILEDSLNQSQSLMHYPVETVYLYSCIARKLLLGDEIEYETAPLNQIAPTNGFFTYGELVHQHHQNMLLNQTLTMVALSEGNASIEKPSIQWDKHFRKNARSFKDAMLKAMAQLSTQLAKELEQAKEAYARLAEHDQLTQLFNRYGGERILEAELARASREKMPLAIAIIDIDFFKKVNDTYGHEAGDEVLKRLAKLMQTHTRKYDSVIRWGGEEFLIVLPHTTAEQAKVVLDKLRSSFAKERFEFMQEPVTFSGGVSECQLKKEERTVLKEADEALYQAKQAGRNQILMAQSEPSYGASAKTTALNGAG